MENTAGFDLNRAIADWRHHLGQSPAYRAGDLEEMESHLRDSADQLRTTGLSDEEAFLIAARRVGPAQVLEAEFAKINGRSIWLDRLLWMLVGAQASVLIGAVASTFSWLAGSFILRHFEGSLWLPRVPVGSMQPVSMLLVTLIHLLVIGAIGALCWMLVRGIGPRLSGLLRQPGWLARQMVLLCLAIFLATALSRLAPSMAAYTIDVQTFSNLAMSSAMAGLVLFVVKTVAITWLSVVLIRRRQQLAGG